MGAFLEKCVFVILILLKSAWICDIFNVFTKKSGLKRNFKDTTIKTFFVDLVEIQFSIKWCLPPSLLLFLDDWYNNNEDPWKEIFGGGSKDSYFFPLHLWELHMNLLINDSKREYFKVSFHIQNLIYPHLILVFKLHNIHLELTCPHKFK